MIHDRGKDFGRFGYIGCLRVCQIPRVLYRISRLVSEISISCFDPPLNQIIIIYKVSRYDFRYKCKYSEYRNGDSFFVFFDESPSSKYSRLKSDDAFGS